MKFLSGTILMFLLGAMFVSLFLMSTGMDMSSGMSDCPFMAHEEVLCPMKFTEHIHAWKNAFLATTPIIMLFISMMALLIALVAPFLVASKIKTVAILGKQFILKRYTYSYRPLQELFSNGILHPKLF